MSIRKPQPFLSCESRDIRTLLNLTSGEEHALRKTVMAVYRKEISASDYGEPWRELWRTKRGEMTRVAGEANKRIKNLNSTKLKNIAIRAPWYSEWALCQLHKKRPKGPRVEAKEVEANDEAMAVAVAMAEAEVEVEVEADDDDDEAGTRAEVGDRSERHAASKGYIDFVCN